MTNTDLKVLGEVCSIDKQPGAYRDLPYVGLEHVESGSGRFLGSHTATSVKSSTFRFTPAHVLYGRLRAYLNKVLLPEFEGHCSTEIFPLLPSPQLDRRYLFYWLTSAATVAAIDATSTGARMPRANMEKVLDLRIPVPPVPEQRRLVALLDEAFEAIATAKANTDRNLRSAGELFESEAKKLFLQKSHQWPTKTIDQISTNLDSKRVPITKSDRKAGGIPYYGASGVVDYVAEHIFEGDALLVSEDGANLLARATPIAFSVSGRYWVNNHAHVLKFEHMATQRFVEFYLESISLDEYITGSAQPKLNQKALNSIPIPIPDSVEEQAKVVRRLEMGAGLCKSLSTVYASKLATLDELKQSLLHQAFTGQLTAKSADRQLAEAA